ncbi:ATP-binding protein [Streptomyces sp. NPDC006530]|uniref:ATP-binding protein n=1 Tax=Streptomyces sp. NPDC006530 TaxID=3364750 RepID=UPI00368440C1
MADVRADRRAVHWMVPSPWQWQRSDTAEHSLLEEGWKHPVLVIESRAADLAEARHATAEYVRDACPWVDRDAVVLVVSELLGNAVRHTERGDWILCLRSQGAVLTADVQDTSTAPPAPRRPDLAAGGGMGWHIAEDLTSSLDVLPHAHGKTVRAEWHAVDGWQADRPVGRRVTRMALC